MGDTRDFGSPPHVTFLVGSAHTGKTEVGLALRERPGTMVVRGAYFWRDPGQSFGPLDGERDLEGRLQRLAQDELLRTVGVDYAYLEHLAELPDQTYGRLLLLATLEAGRRLEDLSNDPERLVIQIGGLERVMPKVSLDLPEARFVHTVRDPRRYFGSSDSGAWLGRLGRRLASWSSSVTAAIDNRAHAPERYLVVKGDDLIAEPENVASAINHHLDAEITLDGADRSLATKGEPLSDRQRKIVERLVGQHLESLGYAVETSARPSKGPYGAIDASMYHLQRRFATRPGGKG